MKGEEFKHDPNAEQWVDPYPRKKKRGASFWFSSILIALALYALSIGPATRFCFNGVISVSAFNTFYAPLNALYRASPKPIQSIFESYVGAWLTEDMKDARKSTHP
jgi:hypothetical protein